MYGVLYMHFSLSSLIISLSPPCTGTKSMSVARINSYHFYRFISTSSWLKYKGALILTFLLSNSKFYGLIASTKAIEFPTIWANCPLKTRVSEESLAFRTASPYEFGLSVFINMLVVMHSFEGVLSMLE